MNKLQICIILLHEIIQIHLKLKIPFFFFFWTVNFKIFTFNNYKYLIKICNAYFSVYCNVFFCVIALNSGHNY